MMDSHGITLVEDLIRSRRSLRTFSSEVQVDDASVAKIAQAGLYAPYGAATGIPFKEIRKIYIIRQSSPAMEQIRPIIAAHQKNAALKMRILMTLLPFLRSRMKKFAERIHSLSQNGIPGLAECSFYLVAAEKKGFPPVAQQALAHVMQNMWLTATAHGVGFQLLSVTDSLHSRKDFMGILGLAPRQWALAGCALGMPKQTESRTQQERPKDNIYWIG
jgi:nitroreductase